MHYLLFGISIGLLLSIFLGKASLDKKQKAKDGKKAARASINKINTRRQKQKEERIAQVMDLFKKKQKITNNDLEKLLKVSDRTATRYLDELEEEGLINKHGKTRSTYYTKA